MNSHVVEIKLQSWSQYSSEGLEQIFARVGAVQGGGTLQSPVFRGHGCGSWKLQTTLERSPSQKKPNEVVEYYQTILGLYSEIATATGRRWAGLPTFPELSNRMRRENPGLMLDMLLNPHAEVYEYLSYLRHFGYPSPLLDWTASPYVAAFFAFDSMPHGAENVCIYAMVRNTTNTFSNDYFFYLLGPHIATDPRHFRQQSRYSLCIKTEHSSDREAIYRFIPLESEGIAGALGPGGLLYRVLIPRAERETALRDLERMNINSYTLFGGEDALIRTLTRRSLEWG